VVRLALGIVFFAHGAQKVFGWFGGAGLKATIRTFQQYMKVPPAATTLAAFIECFGGLALIVGALARPAAVGIIVVMLVAIAKVHWKNGFFLATQPGQANGWEYNFALIAMALAVLIGGAGALSVDHLLHPYGN
jgi:putative oxidoreductase